MHRTHWASPMLLILVVPAAFIVGCGPPSPDDKTNPSETQGGATGVGQYQARDLSVQLGDYMPPLEGGALEIAPPKGWDWKRPPGDYVVGFVPSGSELNSLPRILVSAEDSPYTDISRVSKDNLQEFVEAVSGALAGQELGDPVRGLVLGENAFACSVTFAKRKNAVVSRQIVETVVAGRRYAVRLEVYERQFDKYRDAAYAVAMSMKFTGGNDSSSPVAEAPAMEEPLAEEPADAVPATEASE